MALIRPGESDAKRKLRDIGCFFLDLDGTVYLSDHLIEGTRDFFDRALQSGRKILFLTNNSSHSDLFYRNKLQRLGIREELLGNLLTSTMAAETMVSRRFGNSTGYVCCNREVQEEIQRSLPGAVFDWDWESGTLPAYVFVTFDTELTYRKLTILTNLIRKGAPYIATHPDLNCPVEHGVLPDAGSILAFLKASTGKDPDMIAGKPGSAILKIAAEKMGVPLSSCCMGGDRIASDVLAGINAGIRSLLVFSGGDGPAELERSGVVPDFVCDRLSDLIPYL